MTDILLSLAKVLAVTYILVCVLLFVFQEKMIFIGGKGENWLYNKHASLSFSLCSDSSTTGWWLRPIEERRKNAIVYFGGNAEDVIHTLDWVPSSLRTHSWVFVNYPGFGTNPGKPGQQSMFDAADSVMSCLINEHGYEPNSIMILGRSLGSGVASYVATRYDVGGIVFVTPFDSLASVAAGHYPVFPVRTLLRHPFNSLEGSTKQAMPPMLMITADNDRIVPVRHAERLFEKWRGPKKALSLSGRNHNDLHLDKEYTARIRSFLDELTGAK